MVGGRARGSASAPWPGRPRSPRRGSSHGPAGPPRHPRPARPGPAAIRPGRRLLLPRHRAAPGTLRERPPSPGTRRHGARDVAAVRRGPAGNLLGSPPRSARPQRAPGARRNPPRCQRDPTGISRSTTGTSLGSCWDRSRHRRESAWVSLGSHRDPGRGRGTAGSAAGLPGSPPGQPLHHQISSGLLPGSPGSATGSLKSAQDHQDHARFTPGITRATPGSALLFSWDLSGIPLSPQCGISLGSPLGSSGSHQEQMGDHGGHTWMSCRAARITRATPGSLVGQAGSYWDLSASHWDHPQDHGDHTWTPTPLGTRTLGLFQASFALKITKIPLFPFTGHFPSSQSLEELLHGMVSEHFRRPSCFYDAYSHGILQTTFTASNIEISGISPGLGAWCEQE